LKTSEEAICRAGDQTCKYTFTDTLPTVSAVAAEYDSGNEKWLIKATGTGFTGAKETVTLEINGKVQPATAVSTTEATFEVTDVASGTIEKNLFLYFPEGIPKGHDVVKTGVKLTPKLTKVTPNLGSTEGNVIEATVLGVGTGTTGLMLVDESGGDLCTDVKITAYSKVVCTTKPGAITKGVVKVKTDSVHDCAATDTKKCEFE
jgi:hypothetical protein